MGHTPNISAISDSDLLSAYMHSGDSRYLSEIFTRFSGFVFSVSMKYLSNVDDAKDASMQVFEKLISSLKEQKVDTIKPWLYVVTKNHCLMYIRSAKIQTDPLGEDHFSNESFMESGEYLHPQYEEHEQKLTSMESAIGKLKPDQQKCIRMFYLEEKCYKAIAKETGYTEKEIKSFIQNGKRNLKQMLTGVSLLIGTIIAHLFFR